MGSRRVLVAGPMKPSKGHDSHCFELSRFVTCLDSSNSSGYEEKKESWYNFSYGDQEQGCHCVKDKV